ncbi:MAG: DUF5312 domain-containing protein [Treponema sp.]|jgi:hypothetical protein|nr:DUF5312 domain-containing protein [Treponema sp.]
MALKFFAKLFSFFHWGRGGDNRHRLLKKLARDIQGSRHAAFYKPKSMEIQPAMGKFFYDLYKNLAHGQVFLQNAAKSVQLKQIIVETFLDMKFLDARQRLNADYLKERAQTMPLIEVSHLLREDLAILSGAFDADFISRVDTCYNRILSLVHLVCFDYFFFLRKFDPNIQERNFTAVPRFKPIRGVALLEDIKDFLDVSYSIGIDADWTMILQILKTYKNDIDAIKEDEWTQALNKLKELRRSSILELMVRHISQDPRYEFIVSANPEHIAAAYLEERRQEVEDAFTGFLYSQKQNQITVLARELFGDPDIRRLQHYTEKENEAFVQAGLKGFTYTQCLNYLKVFLIDFFQQDMQNLCELLLIRGHWASLEQSREMSETFHTLLDNTNRLLALEQSLGENGEDGARLRSVLLKSAKNQSQLRQLNSILKGINDEVWDLLNSSARALILLGGQFKEILVDAKKDGMYISNFRELQKETESPMAQRLIISYKRIYAYLQLQQLITGVDDGSTNPLTA